MSPDVPEAGLHPVVRGTETSRTAFPALAGAVFVVATGYGVVFPLLPVLLRRWMGEPDAALAAWHTGALTGIYMLALAAAAPLWGRVSDRGGRRPVLALGLAGYAASLALLALAQSMPLTYVLRFAAGAFAGAVIPVATALAAETADASRRARRVTWLAAASLTGYVVGPALSGWVYGWAWRMSGSDPAAAAADAMVAWPLYAGAVLAVVVAVAGRLVLPTAPSAAPPPPVAHAGDRGRTVLIAALSLLVMSGLGAFEVGIALFAQQALALGPVGLAWMFAECSVAMLAVQALLVSAPWFSRLPGSAVVISGFAAMAIGFALLPYASAPWALFVAVALIGAGSGVLLPMLSYLVTVGATAGLGVVLGAQTAAASLGQALGSAAGGALFGRFSGGSFWMGAALMAAAAAVAAAQRARLSAAYTDRQ
jgi:MFS family permease